MRTQVRKAKREGLPPQHYLSAAALAPPSVADLARVRALGDQAAQIAAWRPQFPQHCFAHHLGPRPDGADAGSGSGGCTRDRTCAFLHCDATGAGDDNGDAAPPAGGRYEAAPSWLQENNA